MAPRIVFLIMSAQQPGPLVEQLVDLLFGHQVVIHHDYTKVPDFVVRRPSVRMVPHPRVTGWGTWGFAEGVLHAIAYCLEEVEFDYLQLLSPTCLPIRPVDDLASNIASEGRDVNADIIALDEHPDAWMAYIARASLPAGSLRLRVARRVTQMYFGAHLRYGQGSRADMFRSMILPWRDPSSADLRSAVAGTMLRSTMTALTYNPTAAQIYRGGLRPAVGSTWFGAKRHVCRFLVDRVSKDTAIRSFFSRLPTLDEHLFPSLLLESGFKRGPSNHWVSPFYRGHPRWMGPDDLDTARESGRFFARKFSVHLDDPTRLAVTNQFSRANADAPRVVEGV